MLKEFVDSLEQAHFRQGPCGSEFELPVSHQALDRANAALELALACVPVMLFARTIPPRALVAGLVLHRAGVSLENIYKNNLGDHDFDRLAVWLARLAKAKLALVEGCPQRQSPWRSISLEERT